jgi:hypothetical protein
MDGIGKGEQCPELIAGESVTGNRKFKTDEISVVLKR